MNFLVTDVNPSIHLIELLAFITVFRSMLRISESALARLTPLTVQERLLAAANDILHRRASEGNPRNFYSRVLETLQHIYDLLFGRHAVG